MERLASCYNDKIIAPLKDHMFPSFVQKFRDNVKKEAMELKVYIEIGMIQFRLLNYEVSRQ